MAQKSTLAFTATPGPLRTISAKTEYVAPASAAAAPRAKVTLLDPHTGRPLRDVARWQ